MISEFDFIDNDILLRIKKKKNWNVKDLSSVMLGALNLDHISSCLSQTQFLKLFFILKKYIFV